MTAASSKYNNLITVPCVSLAELSMCRNKKNGTASRLDLIFSKISGTTLACVGIMRWISSSVQDPRLRLSFSRRPDPQLSVLQDLFGNGAAAACIGSGMRSRSAFKIVRSLCGITVGVSVAVGGESTEATSKVLRASCSRSLSR